MSIVFLKGTWKQAADKTVLIKEPACTHGLSLLGWLLQGQSLQEHIKPVQKPRVHPAVISWLVTPSGLSWRAQAVPATVTDISLSYKSPAEFQHNSSSSDGGCHFLWSEQDDPPTHTE